MSAKDQVLELVNKFKKENFLRDKTDAMGDGLLLGANLADEANELSKTTDRDFKVLQQEYTENGNGAQTTAEILVARDGEETIADRLIRDKNNVDSQLEQTITLKASGLSDTDRVQNALNNYSLVRIVESDYPLNIGRIEFPSDTTIAGIGDAVVNLTQASGGFHAIGKDNIGVYDLKIHGGQIAHATDPNNGDTGIYFENCTRLKIKNVKTDNTKAWGIILLNCDIALVDSCEASGSGKQSGIGLVGTTNFVVSKNTTYNNKYAGIIIEPNNNHGIVTDNISYLNEIGILVMYSDDVLVTHNRTYTNYEVGISAQQSSDISVKINESYANGDSTNTTKGRGFYSIDVVNLVFEGNDIYNNNSSGAEIINTTMMDGLSLKINRIINNCKTDTSVNAHGLMIVKAKDLVYEDNSTYGHKRDLYISADSTIRSFKVSAQANSDITATSDVPTIPAFKDLNFLEYTLNPADAAETFLLPFNAKIYGIVVTYRVNNITGGGYINVNLNDNQYGRVYPTVANVTCQSSMTIANTLQKVFMSGSSLKISYTHSLNMAYPDFVKVKILYM